jgi:uncharacterized protein YjbJ (UPF0337 family)
LERAASAALFFLPPEPSRRTAVDAGKFNPGDANMVNKDQVSGVARQAKGAVTEAAGKITGNRKTELKGKAEKVEGKVQKAVGDVKEKVRKAH